MNIKTIDINLSEANKTFIDTKLNKYTNEVKVVFDNKLEEFSVSSYLILSDIKCSDKYFESRSAYFDKAVLKLRDLLNREFTIYKSKETKKKKALIKEYRDTHSIEEVSITEDDLD